MLQYQFELIVKIVNNGAPALAEELNNSLNDLVIDRNNLAAENEKLREELNALKATAEAEVVEENKEG